MAESTLYKFVQSDQKFIFPVIHIRYKEYLISIFIAIIISHCVISLMSIRDGLNGYLLHTRIVSFSLSRKIKNRGLVESSPLREKNDQNVRMRLASTFVSLWSATGSAIRKETCSFIPKVNAGPMPKPVSP